MKVFVQLLFLCLSLQVSGQNSLPNPCADPKYREFDFWIGNWDVYGPKGNKAGESSISLILDSCIIFEEWTSQTKQGNVVYKGKSFNTYNALLNQWQQTWVDNTGSSTHYIYGKFENNKMEFLTAPFPVNKDTSVIQRLTFF